MFNEIHTVNGVLISITVRVTTNNNNGRNGISKYQPTSPAPALAHKQFIINKMKSSK